MVYVNMILLGGGVLIRRWSCQPEKFLSGLFFNHKKDLTQSLLITKSTRKKRHTQWPPEESTGSKGLPKTGTKVSVHRPVAPWQCVQP